MKLLIAEFIPFLAATIISFLLGKGSELSLPPIAILVMQLILKIAGVEAEIDFLPHILCSFAAIPYFIKLETINWYSLCIFAFAILNFYWALEHFIAFTKGSRRQRHETTGIPQWILFYFYSTVIACMVFIIIIDMALFILILPATGTWAFAVGIASSMLLFCYKAIAVYICADYVKLDIISAVASAICSASAIVLVLCRSAPIIYLIYCVIANGLIFAHAITIGIIWLIQASRRRKIKSRPTTIVAEAL